jgi:dTDP-4-amino-4,6-dideoxygalactose transaminase
MNELQAAFGLLNLKKVNNAIEKKKKLFERYHVHLKGIPGLRFQRINSGTSYNYSYLNIEILPDEFGLTRDDVYICMRKEGIMVRKYFFPLCSNYSCYHSLPSAKVEMLPNANRLALRILCLPLYDEMDEEEVDKIMEVFSLLHYNAAEIKGLISHLGNTDAS